MRDAGLGQRELSKRTGQTFAFTHKVLSGHRTVEFTEFLDLAAALDVDPVELLRRVVGDSSRP